MRITAVSAWFPTKRAPSRGSFVVRDLHAIARHHDVRIVHLVPEQDDDGTRRETVEGIEVLRIPMTPRNPASVARAARQLPAALAGADLIHTMAFPTLLPLSVPGFRRPSDVPWVHTEHWSALSTPASLPAPVRPGVPVLARLLRGPDRVTSVCEFLAEPIREVRRGRPVDIVPCIVEPGPLVERRDRSDGRLCLVSTGGLIPRKDPAVAVRTVAELVSRGVDAHLTWLGDGPLREETLMLADELGLQGRVSLPGTMDGAGVRRALGEADLFFGPTKADNFFVSAAEAIVAGRPVVLGATGGQGEYVADHVGELVGEQNPVLYADAIEQVDERTRSLSAKEIADTIGDRFSSDQVGRGYAGVYEDTVHCITESEFSVRNDFSAAYSAEKGAAPVDVIIACHSPERPVGRAVASVLDGNGDLATCTVVCHNVNPTRIREAILPQHRSRVKFIEHHDAYRSASGPFNAGIGQSTAEFIAILGSDDQLAPGAVASWLAIQGSTGADFVITRLALGSADQGVPTPACRMWNKGHVDLLRDRLAYRSAPLGLIRREALGRIGAHLVEGATVGGDVAMVTHMMAVLPTAYDRFGPPYVIGEDAGDRVTYVIRPIAEQLGFIADLLRADWFGALSDSHRRSIAVKLLRIHVFGAVFYRQDESVWTAEERESLASSTRRIIEAAPDCLNPLSRADRRLVGACLNPAVPVRTLIQAAHERRRHGRPSTVLTRDARYLLHPDAPARFMAASLTVKHLPRLRSLFRR